MMKFGHIAIALGTVLALSGCAGTGKNVSTAPTNNTTPVSKPRALETAYDYNQQIEKQLKNKDTKGLAASIDLSLGLKLRHLQANEKTEKMLASQGMVRQLAATMATGLREYSGKGLSYRYSESYDQYWVSHYQYLGDSMVDFDLYVDKKSGKIIDLQERPFVYSTLETFVLLMDQSFELLEKGDFAGSYVYGNWMKQPGRFMSGAVSFDTFKKTYQALPESMKKKRFVSEMMVRATVRAEKDPAKRSELLGLVAAEHPSAAMLESHYVDTDQLDKAIEVIKALSPAVKDTFINHSELSVLYSETGQLDKALEHAFEAVYKEPDSLYPYIFLLMTTFKGNMYDLTDKTLDVIDAKWLNVVDEQWIKDFDDSKDYLESGAFADWQARHSKK